MRARLQSLLAIALALLAPAALMGANKLQRVTLESHGGGLRLVMETNAETEFTSGRLSNPERIYFDLESATPASGNKHQTVAGQGMVERIRIAVTRKATTRVVLDLKEAAEFETLRQTKPHQIVVELHGEKPAVTSVRTQPEPVIAAASRPRPKKFVPPPPPVYPPTPEIEAPRITLFRPPRDIAMLRMPIPFVMPRVAPPKKTTVAVAESKKPKPIEPAVKTRAKTPAALTKADARKVDAKLDSRRVPIEPLETAADAPMGEPARDAATLTRALGLKLRRVVLDAGHGGKDTGTISPHGLYEKDLVLDVTKRLGRLIEDRLGSQVIFTREDDTFVPLQERTAIANRERADLFLSIHANSSRAESVAGFETYYLNFTGAKADMDVAARENAASEKTIADLSDLVKQITMNEKLDESREFAEQVREATFALAQKSGKTRDRGVKKAPFVVLIGAHMPSVLVEIGFLTNPAEESQMKRADYRQKIAEALYEGISGYADTLSHYTTAAAQTPAAGTEAGN